MKRFFVEYMIDGENKTNFVTSQGVVNVLQSLLFSAISRGKGIEHVTIHVCK